MYLFWKYTGSIVYKHPISLCQEVFGCLGYLLSHFTFARLGKMVAAFIYATSKGCFLFFLLSLLYNNHFQVRGLILKTPCLT